jgi:amino acid permease
MNNTVKLKGTEILVLAAIETENLRKKIPKAIQTVIYRISIFYVGSMTVAGLLVAHNSTTLESAGGAGGAAVSPFMIAFYSLNYGDTTDLVVELTAVIISLIPVLSSHLCKCPLMIIWPVGISIENCY